MIDEMKLDIRPPAGILKVFSRLSYTPWYALAEFVDNSTQSYYSNIHAMKENGKDYLSIIIDYDNKLDILTIKDNAHGMNLEDFKRAILLDSPGSEVNTRNEFGMGLKTAASWFGNKWYIESVELNSGIKYSAEVDILHLDSTGDSHITINQEKVHNGEHGTTLIIKDLTKEISSRGTTTKIKDLLSSMYRRDLKNQEIQISFNGEFLHFEPYIPLEFKEKVWIKDIDFSFDYKGEIHEVNGFVGIMATGGFAKSGFSLFRRNRVIIGGLDQNYKPLEIFKQAQSQISLKLYGELNLDSFPVNQAKDGFVWDGGLEETFIEELKLKILDYIKIADLSKKERVNQESINISQSTLVQTSVQNDLYNFTNSQIVLHEESEVNDYLLSQEEMNNALEEESFPRSYEIPHNDEIFNLEVKWSITPHKPLYSYRVDKDRKITVVDININHAFFKPFSRNIEFKIVIEKLIISLVVSEKIARRTSEDGRTTPYNSIRVNLNNLLKSWDS